MKLRRCVLAALGLAVVLVVSGCGVGHVQTITAEQAGRRVENHVRALAAALPGARLEIQDPHHVDPCTQPQDDGPLGRVFAGVAYWVRDVPPERNAEIFDVVLQFWAAQGYRVTEDNRPQRASVRAKAPEPDGVTLAFMESGDGSQVLSIAASSPCVWRDGSPPS